MISLLGRRCRPNFEMLASPAIVDSIVFSAAKAPTMFRLRDKEIQPFPHNDKSIRVSNQDFAIPAC